MKKLLFIAMLALLLVGCKSKVRKLNEQKVTQITWKVYAIPIRSNGMTYRVYSNKLGGVHVVNETLDSLNYIKLIK